MVDAAEEDEEDTTNTNYKNNNNDLNRNDNSDDDEDEDIQIVQAPTEMEPHKKHVRHTTDGCDTVTYFHSCQCSSRRTLIPHWGEGREGREGR